MNKEHFIRKFVTVNVGDNEVCKSVEYFDFPTGHIITSVHSVEDKKLLVCFSYIKEEHKPRELVTDKDQEESQPIIGFMFDNLDSMKAIGTNLIRAAEYYGEKQGKRP